MTNDIEKEIGAIVDKALNWEHLKLSEVEWAKYDSQYDMAKEIATASIMGVVERERDNATINSFKQFIVGENLLTNEDAYKKTLEAYFEWEAHKGFTDRNELLGLFKKAFGIKEINT